MNPDTRPSGTDQLVAAIQTEQETLRKRYGEIAKAAESVIQITPYQKEHIRGIGSGVVIGNKILTAAHVILGADDIVFYMNANGYNISTTFDGGDIVVDEKLDIALLPLPEVYKGFVPSLPFGSSDRPQESNFVIGYPQLKQDIEWPLGRRPTIHKVRDTIQINMDTLLLARAADPKVGNGYGASGSPLVDSAGKIIGIVHKGASRDEFPKVRSSYFVAVPINLISSTFSRDLMDK